MSGNIVEEGRGASVVVVENQAGSRISLQGRDAESSTGKAEAKSMEKGGKAGPHRVSFKPQGPYGRRDKRARAQTLSGISWERLSGNLFVK